MDYGFNLDALALKPSDFCNDRVIPDLSKQRRVVRLAAAFISGLQAALPVSSGSTGR
jgi:hypothetical protein